MPAANGDVPAARGESPPQGPERSEPPATRHTTSIPRRVSNPVPQGSVDCVSATRLLRGFHARGAGAGGGTGHLYAPVGAAEDVDGEDEVGEDAQKLGEDRPQPVGQLVLDPPECV